MNIIQPATMSAGPGDGVVTRSGGRRLGTVRQVSDAYSGVFTEAALRDMIFKAEDRFNSRGERIRGNGLAEAGAIVRIGRKVLFDLDAFDAWIESKKTRQGQC